METNDRIHFNYPFLKKNRLLYRQYQQNIVKRCKDKNSLVILPTGLGKTIIAVLLIAKTLEKYPKGKIIILAPTRPLVSQHRTSCEKFLDLQKESIITLTGRVSPEKRALQFFQSQIIISTPQVIKNDLERGRYSLKHVSMIVFDESHRTKGNYAYNSISKEYIETCSDPLILGLTASPGKDYENIQELCDNLFIENVVFKNYDDKDIKKYIYEIDTFLELVDLPIKLLELSAIWDNLFQQFLRFFMERKLIPPNKPYYSKLDFLSLSRDLTISLRLENEYDSKLSELDFAEFLYFKSPKVIDIVRERNLNIQSIFSYCSSCISLLHGKDLLETQNLTLFSSFLNNLEYKADHDVLSAKRIVDSEHLKFIKMLLKTCKDEISHPKISKLLSILEEELEDNHNDRILIFTQYREMAEFLKNKLKEELNSRITIEKFIGQTSKIDDLGYSQDKQIELLNQFREGKINILIATSVAEEGLDIPNVDAIIFYEPVPSEIRLIQRRGRTGRTAPGRCYILATRSTVDIPFHKVSQRKEMTMNYVLSHPKQLDLSNDLKRKNIDFSTLLEGYSEDNSIKKVQERKRKERELLANRSIEEIISELDNFVNSTEYKNLKNYGITLYNDVIDLNNSRLKDSVIKLKTRGKRTITEKKHYLNKNLKKIINIAKNFCVDGMIDFQYFKKLVCNEDILEDKFYIHFNQACYLGYLKKSGYNVQFIMNYE
ncbi:MAG: DEAD/DEAH box helicase [Candidatus Hodarchaeota archaeon]